MKIGEYIIADIIGVGIYEIISFSEYHVTVRLKKLFLKGWQWRNHETCCHNRPNKIDIEKWGSYKRISHAKH